MVAPPLAVDIAMRRLVHCRGPCAYVRRHRILCNLQTYCKLPGGLLHASAVVPLLLLPFGTILVFLAWTVRVLLPCHCRVPDRRRFASFIPLPYAQCLQYHSYSVCHTMTAVYMGLERSLFLFYRRSSVDRSVNAGEESSPLLQPEHLRFGSPAMWFSSYYNRVRLPVKTRRLFWHYGAFALCAALLLCHTCSVHNTCPGGGIFWLRFATSPPLRARRGKTPLAYCACHCYRYCACTTLCLPSRRITPRDRALVGQHAGQRAHRCCPRSYHIHLNRTCYLGRDMPGTGRYRLHTRGLRQQSAPFYPLCAHFIPAAAPNERCRFHGAFSAPRLGRTGVYREA